MGFRVVSAPVKLILQCSHADGCSRELLEPLDTSLAEPFAVAEGTTRARSLGWFVTLGDETDRRTLPQVYCPGHAPAPGFRRRVLGMWPAQ